MHQDIQQALTLPVDEVGTALLGISEDQWYDRKSARTQAKDLANAIIGFANAEGGTIVMGLHGGKVEGVMAVDRRNEWRQVPADYTNPPVRVRYRGVACVNEHGNDDELLVAEVETSDRVHANHRDEVYLRIGDENRRLNFAQRRELEFDKGQSNYEATASRASSLEDLDDDLVRDFAARLGKPNQNRLLKARGLVDNSGEPNVGAVLLFGRHPQSEFPEAYVRVLRYRGTGRGAGRRQQVSEDIRVEGPLPDQVREAQRRITALMPTRRALGVGGTFTDVGAVPHDAWLEGLVNAVIHRSYSAMGDHIRVEIFDDRMEIESPGRFPGIVDVSDPTEIARFARNPRIARVMSDLEFGQELGEGIRRMFEEMRLAGLAEPRYHQTAGSVQLTLSYEPIDRELEARLPPRARELARTIRELGRASTGELMRITRRSRPLILQDLRELQDAEIVEWIGNSQKDPRAYWRLKVD